MTGRRSDTPCSSCHYTCWLSRTTSPPPSLSTFLTVTCHSPVNSSPPFSRFRRGWTLCWNIDREVSCVQRTREQKKAKQAASFFSKIFKGKKLLASRSLTIHLRTYAVAISHARDAHLGNLPRLFLATLSLNRVVSLPCCWITFSAAHCHCTRNPLNLLFLLWPTSLCLRVFAITPSLSGGSTDCCRPGCLQTWCS